MTGEKQKETIAKEIRDKTRALAARNNEDEREGGKVQCNATDVTTKDRGGKRFEV